MATAIAGLLAVVACISALAAMSGARSSQLAAPEHHLRIIITVLQLISSASFLALLQRRERVARRIAGVIVCFCFYVMLSWAFDLSKPLLALSLLGWQPIPLVHSDLDQGLLLELRNIAISVFALTLPRFGLVLRPFAASLALCTGFMSAIILFTVLGPQHAWPSVANIDTGTVLLATATLAQNIAIMIAASRAERNMWLSMLGFTALLLCGVLISAQSRTSERRQLHQTTADAAQEISRIFGSNLRTATEEFDAMVRKWQGLRWRAADDVWASDVESHMRHVRGQLGVIEFDAHGLISRGVLRDSNEPERLAFVKDSASLEAMLGENTAFMARVRQVLASGKPTFQARVSSSPRTDEYIHVLNDVDGTVRGVVLVRFEPAQFVSWSLQEVARGFDVEIDMDGEALYRRTTTSRYTYLRPLLGEHVTFAWSPWQWSIEVWPTDAVIGRHITPWPGVLMLFAWGAIVLYAAALQFSHRSRETAADRERILQQSLDLICTINSAGELVTVSAASERMFGSAPAELVGKAWSELVHARDRERAAQALAHAMSANHVPDLEIRCLRKDGGSAFVQWSLRWSEEAQMFYCIARDITENRLSQLRVRDREEVFRRAAELTGTVVVSWERACGERLILGAVEKVFGSEGFDPTKTELIRRRIHADEVDAYVSMRDSVLLFGGSAHGVYRLRLPDGTYGIFDITVISWRDAQTGVARQFVTLTDSTQRELANRERRRYTEQLAALAELARRVTSMRSVQELCDETAKALLELALSTQAAIIGSAAADAQCSHAAAFSGGGALRNVRPGPEMAAVVANGEKPVRLGREELAGCSFWLCEEGAVSTDINGWLAVPVIGRDGTHIGSLHVGDRIEGAYTDADEKVLVQLAGLIAVALENITLYGQLEHRVAERTRELEMSNRELEAFSYSVSHDLRAPLRAIAGFSGLLRQDYVQSLAPQAASYLERIEGAVKRMADLIDDLLSLARVSRIELSRSLLDISALARKVADEHRDRAGNRRIEVRVDLEMRTYGDARLISVALENLIQNAFKFTSTRELAQVHIGQRQHQGENVFFVSDNGVGFDPAHANNLFGVFQRLHSVSEFPGTGVGLAIVHRIVQRHRGRVWAEAELDRGATFYFTLGG